MIIELIIGFVVGVGVSAYYCRKRFGPLVRKGLTEEGCVKFLEEKNYLVKPGDK